MRSAGVPACRRPRGGDDSTRHRFASASPGHQLPVPAILRFQRPAADVGSALAGARHARPARRRDPPGCSTPRQWFGRSAPVVLEIGSGTGTSTLAMAQGRTAYRCGRGRGVPAWAGPVAQRDRRAKRSPTSAWSAATESTCSSTCSARIADRGAGVLPRPVAQGAPPQAPAAAAGHRRPDRRPAAPRRCAARRHRPRRVRRTDRRVRRRRTPAAPRHGRRTTSLPISVARPITKYETKARDAGSAVAELLWEKRSSMSITEEIVEAPAAGARNGTGFCWSGTHPTSTWVSAPSSAAGRPPRTGPDSTRSAAGCWPAPPNCRAGQDNVSAGAGGHRLHQHRPGQRRRRQAVGGGAA